MAHAIPVKLHVPMESELHQAFTGANKNVDTMYPVEMLHYNIGSNDGLVKWMKDYHDEWVEPARRTEYRSVYADVNIYWRMMKVTHTHTRTQTFALSQHSTCIS